MIIGLANSKGGVGKSKLAANLMVYLNDRYAATALVDAEEHAPTKRILDKFDSSLQTRQANTVEDITGNVLDLEEQGYSVIIDAPGKQGEQVETLCVLSNLIIVPIQVAEQDLLQTTAVLELIREQQAMEKNPTPAFVVLTLTRANDIDSPVMRKVLDKYGIPVAKTEIRYKTHIKRNRSVMRDKKLRKHGVDIVSLVEELIDPLLPPIQRSANE